MSISAKLALTGSVLLLLVSMSAALFGDAALINTGVSGVVPPLFSWIAGIVASGLGIAGSRLLEASPVRSRVLLAAASFAGTVTAALMSLGFHAGFWQTLLFFAPAALMIAAFILSLLPQKPLPRNNGFI
jgi:hypothetical protein